MSKLTAFVAVEKRKEATIGSMQKIEMREESGRGRQKSGAAGPGRGGSRMVSSFVAKPAKLSIGSAEKSKKSKKESSRERHEAPKLARKSSNSSLSADLLATKSHAPIYESMAAPMAPMQQAVGSRSLVASPSAPSALSASSSASSNDVRGVIKQQAFNGSFSMQTLKALAPKVDATNVQNLLKTAGIEANSKSEAAAVTLMVAVLFELKFGDEKNVWDLVVKKAKTWAKKELGDIDLAALEAAAKTYLATAL
jgi:hypothetical protein